jgi:hypothetical protein
MQVASTPQKTVSMKIIFVDSKIICTFASSTSRAFDGLWGYKLLWSA